MAATVLRHIVRFDMDNALVRDASVNVWHTICPDATDPTVSATAVQTAIIDFYTGVHAGSTARVSDMFSSLMSGSWNIRSYNLGEAEPRVPLLNVNPTAFTPSSFTQATEVALCLSFRQNPASGVNPRRTRGRIYIGPLGSAAAVIETSTGRPTVSANGIVPTLDAAATDLLADSVASSTWDWAVYSPTNGTAVAVQSGWIDNAFDTQRRRGIAATTRTTF